MMYYVGGFSYVELSLQLWDEASFIMLDDFSNVFLNLVCSILLSIFCINVNEGDWIAIIYLSCILFGWATRVTVAL